MNLVKSLILESLLKTSAPDRVPRTGEKAEQVDCNVVYFCSERIECLKLILEETLVERAYEVHSTSLSTLLYTQKWIFHPDKTRQVGYNELLLSSLEKSGDLEKTKDGFKLLPKALLTISQYEEDQKKHRENVAQSKAMKWLTLALIIVGLAQAIVVFLT
jgi:hypothetical protein